MLDVEAPDLIRPAHLWVPPRLSSAGSEAVDLARDVGIGIDPEQALAIDAILSEGPLEQPWAALEAAIIEARQNGKTMGVIKPVVIANVILFGATLIAWTAHRFVTAQESFLSLQETITGSPLLSRRLKKISESHGEEEIEFHGQSRTSAGPRIKFLARSKTGGRGLSGNQIVLDEAFALEPSHMGSLIPTLATRRDAQVLYGSSAGLRNSAILRAIRNRGRAGGDPSLVYVEWCAPEGGCTEDDCDHRLGAEGCALDDVERWRAANPAIARGRITVTFVAAERRALTPEEFARERLGWWDDPITGGAELLASWEQCKDEDSAPAGRPVLAIDVAPGSKSAAIVAAMWRPDGLPHLEVVAHAPGVDWIPGRAVELLRHRPLDWVLDPTGPAGAQINRLAEVGIVPRQMSTRDLGQACEEFSSRTEAQQLRHLGDPVMGRAIASAGRRSIGDGLWAWSRTRSETDICPLVGGAEALWALAVSPPEEPPPAAPVNAPADGRSETNELATAGF
ncbi:MULTISPECIES: hypothetical protein [Catenuloplanes]|uniref:Terminase n=1 Tax=Catenuloplanes niger TaxID=587534 RepID=A0AAE3ZT41_9ACTN|nr:hypothetical protein [Catenuloplanes niger]MDR7323385.1 hypothetical protein [Catenuloplanes niger]